MHRINVFAAAASLASFWRATSWVAYGRRRREWRRNG